MTTPTTFDDAKAKLLAHLDRHYATIRAIAEDDKHTNSESREMVEACKEYSETVSDIFDLKKMRDTIDRLSPNP